MKHLNICIRLLASMYLAGLIGLSVETSRNFFQMLTPFHLLTTFVLLVVFQNDRHSAFYSFMILCILASYLAEVAGVHTGVLFGIYRYHTTLGWKVLEVPPLIGINWFILISSTGITIQRFGSQYPAWLKAVAGALIMTAFDYIAEPAAIMLDMWDWYGKQPPLRNYLMWFSLSGLLLYGFYQSPFQKKNPLASWILAFQVVFFFVLNITLKL